MAERLMAAVLKTVVPERVSGVRIPLPPPDEARASRELRLGGRFAPAQLCHVLGEEFARLGQWRLL